MDKHKDTGSDSEGKEKPKDQTFLLGGCVLVCCCVYFFFIYSVQGNDPTVSSSELVSEIPSSRFQTNEQHRELLSKNGNGVSEFFGDASCTWQLPANHAPKALLFAAPGCKHTSFDWWESSASCPQCSPLPEERKIVKEALSRNWAVLVCSQQEVCWRRTDTRRVVPAIQEFQKRHKLEKKPLYAFGASSGGYFMYFLARSIKLTAVMVQIMPMGEDIIWDKSLEWRHPPVFFSFMSRDLQIKRAVEVQAAGLEERGVKVRLNEMKPLPVGDLFLYERIEGVSRQSSKEIKKILKKDGYLNEKNILTVNPREIFPQIRDQIKEVVDRHNIRDSVTPDLSPIFQELNVAYCKHAISADPILEAFDWMESQH